MVVEEPIKKKPVERLMPINIYYGSQQGTASKFAKILSDEGETYGFMPEVVDLTASGQGETIEKGTVGIFCMATHGEGDPTDNAKAFVQWLTDPKENHEQISGFKFTVFGLGNTQYEHYNKIGRVVNKSLEDCGAIRIFKYGEGDDNQSLEEDFNDWK